MCVNGFRLTNKVGGECENKIRRLHLACKTRISEDYALYIVGAQFVYLNLQTRARQP